MHITGLDCTSLHRFRARAIFYPNLYPKEQQSGAELLYVLVIAATGAVGQDAVPAFQAGHAGSIPVARSSSLAFFDSLFPYVRGSGLLLGRKPAHTMFLQFNYNPRTYLC
jgi:hypothetical protein